MGKFLETFLQSIYKSCHSLADMLPVYKAAGTKPSLCLADRFGEYGAHSCSSGDRCSSLAGAYFCTYKKPEISLQEAGEAERKKEKRKPNSLSCKQLLTFYCVILWMYLLYLYLSVMLFTSTTSFSFLWKLLPFTAKHAAFSYVFPLKHCFLRTFWLFLQPLSQVFPKEDLADKSQSILLWACIFRYLWNNLTSTKQSRFWNLTQE